jgi:alpha-1,2-mannosyltransferase
MPLGHFKKLVDPRTPWARACFVAACLTAAAIQGWIIAFYRSFHIRDFDVHREVGRRFFSGEYVYGGGLCYPYMLAAAMYFSPLALIDRNTGLPFGMQSQSSAFS